MPANKRTKVFKREIVTLTPDMVKKFAETPAGCAWNGCMASFRGDMPMGWINLLTYWSPKPADNLNYILRHCQRDAVLCPEHAAALERLLVDIGHALNVPPAGAA